MLDFEVFFNAILCRFHLIVQPCTHAPSQNPCLWLKKFRAHQTLVLFSGLQCTVSVIPTMPEQTKRMWQGWCEIKHLSDITAYSSVRERYSIMLITFWKIPRIFVASPSTRKTVLLLLLVPTGLFAWICLALLRHLTTSIKCYNPYSWVVFLWNQMIILIWCKDIHCRVGGLNRAGEIHEHAGTENRDCSQVRGVTCWNNYETFPNQA